MAADEISRAYARRTPEHGVLHRVVLQTILWELDRHHDERGTPLFVKREGLATTVPTTMATVTDCDSFDDNTERCSIIAAGVGGSGSGLAWLLLPALVLWRRRRR